MKIVRDGVEIELTQEEIRKAYEYEKYRLDREDVESVIEHKNIEVTDEEFERILEFYKRLRRHDETWWEDAEYAVNEEMGTW